MSDEDTAKVRHRPAVLPYLYDFFCLCQLAYSVEFVVFKTLSQLVQFVTGTSNVPLEGFSALQVFDALYWFLFSVTRIRACMAHNDFKFIEATV
jgi:hypothetical protein